MKKKRLLFLVAFLAIVVPLFAISYGHNLAQTLRVLRNELSADYRQIDKNRDRLTEDYEKQRQKMIDVMKQCDELSLMLYSQKQGFTFDVSYALQKVAKKYNEFNQDRGPFDHIVSNLTRNHGYEFVKITVGVAYGTDIQRVRELLGEALQTLQDKDAFGRDIVDAKRGVSITLEEMDDSAVTIAVKQQVLVAERVGYIDRAKELIYNTLNENGISIPFPQCDVHLVNEE